MGTVHVHLVWLLYSLLDRATYVGKIYITLTVLEREPGISARIVVMPCFHRMCNGALAKVKTNGVIEYFASSEKGWNGSVASVTNNTSSFEPAPERTMIG
jgi:hypothetical protein